MLRWWHKRSSSLAPDHNRFSTLPNTETHPNTNTCELCQRLQLLHHHSQVTNIASPLCLLTLLSKEMRSGGGEDGMFQRGRWMNYIRGFWSKWCNSWALKILGQTCSRPGSTPDRVDTDGTNHHLWSFIYQSMRRKSSKCVWELYVQPR